MPPPPLLVIAAYYAGLAFALFGTRRPSLAAAMTLLVGSTLAIVSGQPAGWLSDAPTPNRLRLTMFDVGQGDATLVELPDSSRVLVDAGGTPFGGSTFDIGDRVLAPALWARGIRRLDTLVLTHGDPDHIGGAPAILDDFAPARTLGRVPVIRHRAAAGCPVRQARAAGIQVDAAAAGQTCGRPAPRDVRVLHPPLPDWERPRVRNDDSIVLEIVYGDVAVLLLGDVGADVERTIYPAAHSGPAPHPEGRPPRQPHIHIAGAARPLAPDIAVISCGRGNTFGHPAPEVLRRLEAIGARIYRTDLDGQITIDTTAPV